MPDDPRFKQLKDEALQGEAFEAIKAAWSTIPEFRDGTETSRHFDRDGEPVTLAEWGMLMQIDGYRVVKQEQIEGTDVSVSTVWLGMNHSYTPGVKLIFETMVFGMSDGSEQMHRYGTIDEAQVGHRVVVSMLTDQLIQPDDLPVAPRSQIITEVKNVLNGREFDVGD